MQDSINVESFGFLDFWIFRFLDFWVFECLDFWIFGILEFFILEFRSLRFLTCECFLVVLCVVCLLCLASGIHLY